MALGAGNIDALALGADRTVYASAGGRLFVSSDGGRSFRPITMQVAPPFRIRSIAPDPAQPEPSMRRPFGVDDLRSGMLVGWALACDDIDRAVAEARSHGLTQVSQAMGTEPST